MKNGILMSVCVAALLFESSHSARSSSVREQQIAFANAYVAAVQSNDRSRVMAFFHPAVRACINAKTRPFFDSVVSQQLDGFPHGKYSRITVTRVAAKSQPSLWAYLPAKSFPYPVMPAYGIQVEFDSAPDGLFIDMLEVAPVGASWYLVTACPTADGMRLTQEILDKKALQVAKAKRLAAKVRGPLLAQIKKLLAEHDRIGAAQAYQKATGVDFPTAMSVIEAIENPNG